MRYIGNKTRLLDFIGGVLNAHRLSAGVALDAFAGTASVGRYLKRRGFTVASCDVMTYSYVFQKSYVELDALPAFDGLAAVEPALRRLPDDDEPAGADGDATRRTVRVLRFLDTELPPEAGFISRNFSPDAEMADDATGRMYFTSANAGHIDAIRRRLDEWHAAGAIGEDELHLLLACLLEAADAVANTTGVYAAYVKSWQPNALRPLRLALPELVLGTGLGCTAHQGDVNEVIERVGRCDMLYLDPPYNTRQYTGYYHVPEIIARGWADGEPELRGKTGLIAAGSQRSAWSTRRGCVGALRTLLERADAGCVLMSYNSEGIIPESAIEEAFNDFGVPGTYRVHEQRYARYRSDRDRVGRRYKAAAVAERVYFVKLRG
jgi:adenine-specific DNA-methyltransferase